MMHVDSKKIKEQNKTMMSRLVRISEIRIEIRFRKKIDDLESLKKDITINGLLQHIVIDVNNTLVAGFRRLKACEQLGWKSISCNIIDPKNINPKLCEVSENTERKNFTISEIMDITEYVEKTRIGHRPKKGGNLPPFQKGTKLVPFPTGKTRDIVVKLANISTGQAQKIVEINKAVKKAPKKYKALLDDLDSKKKSVNTVHQRLQISTRKLDNVKIPNGQYNVFEFDFNWGYNNKRIGATGNGGSETQYPVVPPKDVLEKEVPKFTKIISKNSVIFMWVTVPLLHEIINLGILEALGFTYKTMISWHKLYPKNRFGGYGMGYWFLGEMEHCIVGVRGNVTPFRCKLPNFIEAPVTRHSEKPIEFKKLFEKATENIPNRKMFEAHARRQRQNWTCYGNELPKVKSS